jgi:hypothetical protein
MSGMKDLRALLFFAAAAAAAACSTWRWSGGGPSSAPEPSSAPIALGSSPARARTVVIPPTPAERARTAEYYSDFGPETVDVASYSAQQRYNYGIYARTCARCHTLARSINAPIVGRGWWEFYIASMRVRSRWQGRPLPPEDVKAILDFLDYDGRVRKVDGARDFDQVTDELKRRFDAEISRRIEAMQKASPRVSAPPHP